jgi:hypothetical protein
MRAVTVRYRAYPVDPSRPFLRQSVFLELCCGRVFIPRFVSFAQT